MTTTPDTAKTKRRPIAHVVGGFALTALLAVCVIGIPGEEKTRSENASLREDLAAVQTSIETHLAESERLEEARAEKTAELDELHAVLESTDGFLQ